jgi:hypothetical protein
VRLDTDAGKCLLADAAVVAITRLPLLSSQGPAYVDILQVIASQFADAAILTQLYTTHLSSHSLVPPVGFVLE